MQVAGAREVYKFHRFHFIEKRETTATTRADKIKHGSTDEKLKQNK